MRWIDDYFAAWARHAQASDPETGMAERERMLAFMDPGIRYEDVPTGQVFTGHDGIVAMGAQALLMSRDMRFTCISAQESGDQFADVTSNATALFIGRGVVDPDCRQER